MSIEIAPGLERRVARPPWRAAYVVMAGTTMAVLDTTMVNVALHHIGVDLRSTDAVEWVVTAYVLAVCAAQPMTGWLADRFGRKRVFLVAIAGFVLASIGSAAAPNLGVLLVCRVMQGLGTGAIIPVGMAIVLTIFPPAQHGRAVAVWGMVTMLGPGFGPALGGWVATSATWRWLFLVNVPVGVVALVAGSRLLPDQGHRARHPFDFAGLVLGNGGLALAVLGVSEAAAWGWTEPSTLMCLALGVGALAAFVRHELDIDHPMLHLRLFGERSLRLAMGAMCFVTGGYYARLVFVPLELEGPRGETPLTVGMLLLPAALASAVTMAVSGRYIDRVGPRLLIMLGCATMSVASLALAGITLSTPLPLIAATLTVHGLGLGLVMAPVVVAGISTLPPRLTAHGTSIRSLVSQVSAAVTIAVMSAVVAIAAGGDPSPDRAQAAYGAAFVVVAAGLVVAFVLGSRLPRGTARLRAGTDDAVALSSAAGS